MGVKLRGASGPFVLAGISVLFAGIAPVEAQTRLPLLGNRDAAVVATTPGYVFHSDFWMNLHHYLYGISGGGPYEGAGIAEEAAQCFSAFEGEVAAGWDAARRFYGEHLGNRPHRRGIMREIRYRLNGLGRAMPEDRVAREAIDHLQAAAPAYRRCLWDRHDRENREAIGVLVDVLARHALPVQIRLSELYRTAWPRAVPVDLARYTDFAKGNTESGPGLEDHIMIAASVADDAAAALEIALHEASHIVSGPRHGAVSEALAETGERLGVQVPRNLWHALSFHTSGTLVQRAVGTEGTTYEPYWIAGDLFAQLRPAIEAHWEPYVDGDASLGDATENLLTALTAEAPAAAAEASEAAAPSPGDVATIDGIIRAYYVVVSGPAGEAADAARDRTLHHPDAWVAIAGSDEAGRPRVSVMSLDEYHGGNAPRAQGFWEWETEREVRRSGNMAHVWSRYASARTPGGEPFARGVNSITLFHDAERWWIMGWMFDTSAGTEGQ